MKLVLILFFLFVFYLTHKQIDKNDLNYILTFLFIFNSVYMPIEFLIPKIYHYFKKRKNKKEVRNEKKQ